MPELDDTTARILRESREAREEARRIIEEFDVEANVIHGIDPDRFAQLFGEALRGTV